MISRLRDQRALYPAKSRNIQAQQRNLVAGKALYRVSQYFLICIVCPMQCIALRKIYRVGQKNHTVFIAITLSIRNQFSHFFAHEHSIGNLQLEDV